jgi:hypothetical protein
MMSNSVQDNPSQLNQPSLTAQGPSDQQPAPQASPEMLLGSPPKRPYIVLVIVVALLGGGLLGYLSLQQPAPQDATPTEAPPTQTSQSAAPHYVGEQTIMFRDVTGDNSSGSITRTITPGNISYLASISVPGPDEGSFFQLWAQKAEDYTGEDFATDLALIASFEYQAQGSYTLEYDLSFDPQEPFFTSFHHLFNAVVVSLETVDDDVMETRILEGTFTQ